jgi:hypothetical protein
MVQGGYPLIALFAPICQVCTLLPGLHPSARFAPFCFEMLVRYRGMRIGSDPPLAGSCRKLVGNELHGALAVLHTHASPGRRRRLAADELHGARPFYTPQHTTTRLVAFRKVMKTAAESFHSGNHTQSELPESASCFQSRPAVSRVGQLFPESAVFGTSRRILERVGRFWNQSALTTNLGP